MTEQQLEVGVGQDATQVSSPDPDDVVGALDNLLGGCLAGDGEQLLDNVELVAEAVRAARDRIVDLTTRPDGPGSTSIERGQRPGRLAESMGAQRPFWLAASLSDLGLAAEQVDEIPELKRRV